MSRLCTLKSFRQILTSRFKHNFKGKEVEKKDRIWNKVEREGERDKQTNETDKLEYKTEEIKANQQMKEKA